MLLGSVSAAKIGLGEVVSVTTKMGEGVERGLVRASSPRGLVVVCSDGDRSVERFFSDDFYSFIPEAVIEQPILLPQEPLKRNIMDMTPDERVAEKLRMMEQGEDEGEEDPEMDDEGGEGDQPEQEDPEPEGPPATSVDVEKLPDDIKNAIIATKEMDPEQVNTLLSLVGDAALKGLTRANVAQTEILGIGQKIQNATYAVLTRHGLARSTLREVKKK